MINSKNTYSLIFLISLFFIYPGSLSDAFLGNISNYYLVFFFVFLLFFVFVRYSEDRGVLLTSVLLIFLAKIIFFFFHGLFLGEIPFLALKIMVFLLAFYMTVMIVGIDNSLKIIIAFVLINGFLAVFGLIYSQFNGPIFEFISYDNRRALFNGFTIYKSTFEILGERVIRPSGWLDEPGQLAFLLVHVHFINQAYIKKTKLEIAIVFFGVITTSLAFIVYMLAFYMIKFITDVFKLKFKGASILLASSIIILTAYNFNDGVNSAVSHLFIDRMSFSDDNDDRILKGDNRSSLMVKDIELIILSPIMGVGELKFSDVGGGSNIFSWGAIYGVFIYVIIFLPFLIISINLFRMKEYLSLFSFLLLQALYIQRAPFTSFIYLFILSLIMILGFKYVRKK